MSSFHDTAVFPQNISYGSSGGPETSTAILQLDSGEEQRIGRRARPLRQYDVRYGIKSEADLITLQQFYITRRGPLFGFRYFDWLDFSTDSTHVGTPTAVDVNIGTGDGTTQTFQLRKKYVDSGSTEYRPLTKPISPTVVVAVNGTPVTTGWSVDYTSGLITFDVAPAIGDIISAGCTFHTPVRFSKEMDLLSISIDDFKSGSLNVTLSEINDSSPGLPVEFWFGGACEYPLNQSIVLSPSMGRVQKIEPSESGLAVRLPNPENMPTGGPWFYVFNVSDTYTLAITTHDGTAIMTLAVNSAVECVVSVNGSGDKNWDCF